MLPHDRFKLSTLVHLEGPLTLLLATVICISLKCDARAVAGGESQLSVIIADQMLPDFSEVGKRESAAVARPISKNRKGVLAYH